MAAAAAVAARLAAPAVLPAQFLSMYFPEPEAVSFPAVPSYLAAQTDAAGETLVELAAS